MKFGKLDHIEEVDFSLPEDHAVTSKVLDGAPFKTKIQLGGTMWNIRPWKGTWYPEGTRIKDFGMAYCQLFNTIELNATHYKIHPPEIVRKWKSWADKGFTFCPKFPNLITHYRQFLNCEALTDEFFVAVSEFKELMGPCFSQLPERTAPTQAAKIQKYLMTLPTDVKIHIEFRHEGWFQNSPEVEDTWQLIEELGIGSVITDTAGRRDALHMRLTNKTLILRFGGNELDPTDSQRLAEWAQRIKQWSDHGLEEVQMWMHQPDSVLTPETLLIFEQELNKVGIESNVFDQQSTLF